MGVRSSAGRSGAGRRPLRPRRCGRRRCRRPARRCRRPDTWCQRRRHGLVELGRGAEALAARHAGGVGGGVAHEGPGEHAGLRAGAVARRARVAGGRARTGGLVAEIQKLAAPVTCTMSSTMSSSIWPSQSLSWPSRISAEPVVSSLQVGEPQVEIADGAGAAARRARGGRVEAALADPAPVTPAFAVHRRSPGAILLAVAALGVRAEERLVDLAVAVVVEVVAAALLGRDLVEPDQLHGGAVAAYPGGDRQRDDEVGVVGAVGHGDAAGEPGGPCGRELHHAIPRQAARGDEVGPGPRRRTG